MYWNLNSIHYIQNTRKWDNSIESAVDIFQNAITIAKHITFLLGLPLNFEGEYKLFLNKLNIMKLSFSLFLVKYSVLNLLFCLFACSFSFRIITFIRADTEKGPFSSNCSFSVSARMSVMILNGKLHANKQQNRFNREYFTRKRESSYI